VHPILNMFFETGRMYPRHAKWNLLFLMLLLQTFMNVLFNESNLTKEVSCGPSEFDDFLNKLVDSGTEIIMTVLIVTNLMNIIAKLERIDPIFCI
jgi:hypothetical protein